MATHLADSLQDWLDIVLELGTLHKGDELPEQKYLVKLLEASNRHRVDQGLWALAYQGSLEVVDRTRFFVEEAPARTRSIDQIKLIMLEAIETGLITKDTVLPLKEHLAELYNTRVSSVRSAVNWLIEQGVLHTQRRHFTSPTVDAASKSSDLQQSFICKDPVFYGVAKEVISAVRECQTASTAHRVSRTLLAASSKQSCRQAQILLSHFGIFVQVSSAKHPLSYQAVDPTTQAFALGSKACLAWLERRHTIHAGDASSFASLCR